MLSYSLINNHPDLAQLIWHHEQSSPEWFRSSGAVWHKTFADFETFWKACIVYGLFDADKLLATVYIEEIQPAVLNVHVSVVEKCEERDLVRFFQSLVRQYAMEGAEVIVGWMTANNRGLRRVAEKAGFSDTGLRMAYGQTRGKVINWIQMRA